MKDLPQEEQELIKKTYFRALELTKEQKIIEVFDDDKARFNPSFAAILSSNASKMPIIYAIMMSVRSYCPELTRIEHSSVVSAVTMFVEDMTGERVMPKLPKDVMDLLVKISSDMGMTEEMKDMADRNERK